MQSFIAKVGKGHKRAKDLTWDEAKEAMRMIIESQATPGQIGAFLMAMRIKNESITELASFTASARQYVPPLKIETPSEIVDVPMYGEKHDTCHAIVASVLIATAAGASIFMHGTSNTAAASTVPGILKHLGIPTTQPVQQLTQFQLAYLELETYHPPLAKLLDLRQEFGVQNLAHQVARMLNPSRASSQVIGIAHPPYLDKMIEALHMLGTSRAMVLSRCGRNSGIVDFNGNPRPRAEEWPYDPTHDSTTGYWVFPLDHFMPWVTPHCPKAQAQQSRSEMPTLLFNFCRTRFEEITVHGSSSTRLCCSMLQAKPHHLCKPPPSLSMRWIQG